MAAAHAQALLAGEQRYDKVMEEYVVDNIGPAYWAQVWPSALALSKLLLERGPSMFMGKQSTVLELGCGLGLASICAAKAGATNVVATDVEDSALAFTLANAVENGVDGVAATESDTDGSRFSAHRLDWARPEDSPAARNRAHHYDLVLAADVVYDEGAPSLLSPLLHQLTAVDGKVLLTDNADRPYADERRDALLTLLCREGDFELVEQRAMEVALESRQGSRFSIVHCELVRQS